jgi:hypothetical protein
MYTDMRYFRSIHCIHMYKCIIYRCMTHLVIEHCDVVGEAQVCRCQLAGVAAALSHIQLSCVHIGVHNYTIMIYI